jgi:glycosyltransferase involved in cell wall biosynthesis
MTIGIDAHFIEGERTGVGRYLFNLFLEWSKLDPKSLIPNPKFILYFKDKIPEDLPKSVLFESRLLKVSSTAKFLHWNLWRAAKKDRIDILFCPGYIAPIFWRGKLALTLHDIIYESHPEWFNWRSQADKILLKWVSKKSAAKASIIFVPSEFSRSEVAKYYKIDPKKIILTYEAADPGLSAIESEKAELAGRYEIKKKFAFYIGSIFSRRHLPEVIAAFERIAVTDADIQFLISGRDHTKGKIVEGLADELNQRLDRQAILRVDYVSESDLKLLYRRCAFFIWLSDYEGFGLPPLEAAAAGAAVITSDSSSLKEMVGDAAILVKNNSDIKEIYQAMKKLNEDGSLRSQMIEKGKAQAAKFSWAICASQTLEAIIKN